MSEANSTTPSSSGKPAKPAKPSPDFPLTAHPAGYWCNKIKGRTHYFGRRREPRSTLARSLSSGERFATGSKTGSWRRVSWSFWSA
jgi:hypothetical protein